MCKAVGKLSRADVVDHIVAHRGDRSLFWDVSNWQSLCTLCHNRDKQKQERTGRVEGVGVNGVPIDPNHEWKTWQGC